ncbi:hypothetical protein J6590_101432, partial [Homalodisca vitripennis]
FLRRNEKGRHAAYWFENAVRTAITVEDGDSTVLYGECVKSDSLLAIMCLYLVVQYELRIPARMRGARTAARSNNGPARRRASNLQKHILALGSIRSLQLCSQLHYKVI